MTWFSFHGGHSGSFCAHAKGTLEEVVETAIARGFTHYGLSEHVPRYREQDLFPGEEHLGTEGLIRAFEDYARAAFELQERYADRIELLVGFETEALPPDIWPERMRELRRSYPFDYFVGSMHDIDGRWVDFKPAMTDELKAEFGAEALHVTWFERLADMVRLLKPDVVGHIDLIRKFEPPDFAFSPAALRAAEGLLDAARAAGSALDVNCAPVRNGYGAPYPQLPLLEIACRMGIGVTLGDDSHGPDTVGVGLTASLEAIAKAGFRSVRRLSRGRGWEDIPLDQVRPG
ncbi:histidinol-phosphatase [Pleomorphomonas sp. PLEO]|uniref:histidinol-phosphatase n=1 Tax=Pleomorphomonas sp. PLEO TaxID=3239306 RepID=UPI00351F0C6F